MVRKIYRHMDSMGEKYVSEGIKSNNQERLGVLAAPREVRSTFLIARLRSAGGFNL